MPKRYPVKERPRLFFLENDLGWVRSLGFSAESLLREKELRVTYFGGKEVVFPLPPKQPEKIEEPEGFDYKTFGHYPYWTGMSRAIRSRMQHLVLAYAGTSDPRYADKAISYALSLARWDTWSDPDYHYGRMGRTCLDTASLTFGVSVVYDGCHERMSHEERSEVLNGLVRLGLEPLYRDCVWAFTHENPSLRAWNLPLYQHSALGVGALAVMGDVPESDFKRWLNQALDYFLWYLDYQMVSPDTEGMSYDSGSVDNLMVFADVLKRVMGNDRLLRHPYISDILPKNVIYFLGPKNSGSVNFGDCGRGGVYPTTFINTMRIINKHLGNGYAGWYLKKTGKLVLDPKEPFWNILYIPRKPVVRPPHDLPSSAVFWNIGWAALRSGWEDEDTLLAFKCSSSTLGHDHWDQNNFVLNHKGEWLATDIGYGSFRSKEDGYFSRHTVGHNTILVDGEGQKYRAGYIRDFYTAHGYDYVVGDASKCYDGEKLRLFLRHIVYVKPDYFLILDEVEGSGSPHHFEWLLHTDNDGVWRTLGGKELDVGGPVDTPDLMIEKPQARLLVKILLPERIRTLCDRHKGLEVYGPFIRVSPSENGLSRRFLSLLYPLDGKEKVLNLPTVEVVGSSTGGTLGVKVKRGELREIVVFNLVGGLFSVEGIKGDPQNCVVTLEGKRPLKYFLYKGTVLTLNGRILLLSSNPLSAEVRMSDGSLTAEVSAKREVKMLLSSPKPKRVLLNGSNLPPQSFAYNSKMGLLTVWLKEGQHNLIVEM